MEKLGQLLKAEREKKGLSLHEIGMSLKINPKILRAMEENDSANLPAKTFLRGFVRSYAQYLKIDIDHALKLFQEQYGSTRPEESKTPEVTEVNPSNIQNAQIPRNDPPLKKAEDLALPKQSGSRIIQIAVAVVILISIAFVVKMIDKYQKESEIAVNPAIESSIKETTTTTTVLAAAGSESLSTPISTTLPVGGMSTSSTTTTIPATTSTVRAIATTSTSTTMTTTSTLSTTTTIKTKPSTTTVTSTTTSTSTTATTTTVIGGPKLNEVIVEALNAVQIKYILADEPAKTMQLSPDQVHTFKGKKIQLEVNDGGAINIIVNGRDRGVPGTIGKSIKLSFP